MLIYVGNLSFDCMTTCKVSQMRPTTKSQQVLIDLFVEFSSMNYIVKDVNLAPIHQYTLKFHTFPLKVLKRFDEFFCCRYHSSRHRINCIGYIHDNADKIKIKTTRVALIGLACDKPSTAVLSCLPGASKDISYPLTSSHRS